MRASMFAGSILALGIVLAGCGDSSTDVEPTTTPAGTATAVVTRGSDSNITPVSSGATTTATAAAETSTATAISTAEPTSTTAAATATNPPAPTNPPAAINTPPPTVAVQPTAVPTPVPASSNPLTAFVGVSGSGSRYLWAPGSVKIAPGGVVTFSWSGGAAHDLSIPQLGFETPATTSGSYSVTFPAAGTYSIICVLHPPAMRGTVVVQ